jgi:hypothetical protein
MDSVNISAEISAIPCRDDKLSQLCREYADTVPCCSLLQPDRELKRERGKILWGMADCVDLFDLKEELLKADCFTFRNTSWCMFPVLMKGDILLIESIRDNDIKISDIPVYRRYGRLYAHRALDIKEVNRRRFILTKADSLQDLSEDYGGAEMVPIEDVLGVVRQVRRGGRTLSVSKRKATFWEIFFFKKTILDRHIEKKFWLLLHKSLALLQSFYLYQRLGQSIVLRLERAVDLRIALPAGNIGAYEYRPLEKINMLELGAYSVFHIVMRYKKSLIGCVTFLNRGTGCPHKGIWLSDLYVRFRYQHIGFESILLHKAQEFLGQIGAGNICYPKESPVLESFDSRNISPKVIGIKPRLKKSPVLSWNAQELAILLSKGELNEVAIETAVRLIKGGLHWEEFYRVVFESGKIVAVTRRLGQLADSIGIPVDILKRFAEARLQIIYQTEKARHQLMTILDAFSSNCVKVIPLKGTYLSEILYQDISMRGASVDIDLLIREKDKEAARMIMKQLGYSRDKDNGVKKFEWSEGFGKSGFLHVDLHWDITIMIRDQERIEGFWQDSRIATSYSGQGDTTHYRWDAETLLLYLCLTLINNCNFLNLRYFFDIDVLIASTDSLDWRLFINKAKAYKVNNSAYASLLKTKEILGTDIPQFVLDALKPSPVKRLMIKVFLARCVILGNNMRRRFIKEIFSIFFLAFLEADSLAEYLKVIKRLFFPPPQIIAPNYYGQPIFSKRKYLTCILKRFSMAFYIIGKILLGRYPSCRRERAG